MDIIAAAALIAVGIVGAAAVYAKVGGRPPKAPPAVIAPPAATVNGDLPERLAAMGKREAALARREAELEGVRVS